tara:strand:+ start:2482 stop:3288 length:807 start_codon:yes stop_codon:yes gene_type:complete
MLKQKRVAVCFSGQIRDWQFAKKNILKFFSAAHLNEVTVDYFIHTWDTNTWRFPKKHHHEFVDEKHNDFPQLVKIYSPVNYHMSVYKSREWKLTWDPLFYSFEYSMLLKQQYELENNFTYDIVIKARPDIMYNPTKRFPFYHHVNNGSCYTATDIARFPSEFNKQCFDDVMFFGDSKTMDIMSGLYKYYALKNRDSRNLEKTTPQTDINTELHLGPGTLLYQYAVKHNIHPDSYKIDYAIVRSTMRGKELDSVEDYDKIKKLWQEWYI